MIRKQSMGLWHGNEHGETQNEVTLSSCQDVTVNIKNNGEQLDDVSSFKYTGAIIPVERSSCTKECEQGLEFLRQTWQG